MSNPVELRAKNCTNCLRKPATIVAKGLIAAATVAAVSSAIFFIIAASVNPLPTPGFLGYVAMVIATSKPIFGIIPYKTLIYGLSSVTLALAMVNTGLIVKTMHDPSQIEILRRNWRPEIFSDNYLNDTGLELLPEARKYLQSYINFLKSHGCDVDQFPENFLAITTTKAYRALKFGHLNKPHAKKFYLSMERELENRDEQSSLERSRSVSWSQSGSEAMEVDSSYYEEAHDDDSDPDSGNEAEFLPTPFHLTDEYIKEHVPENKREKYLQDFRDAGVKVNLLRAYPNLCAHKRNFGEKWPDVRNLIIAANS